MSIYVRLALISTFPFSSGFFHGPSAVKLIASAGYPLERHHVTTEDGYILEMHRIPHGRNTTCQGLKKGENVTSDEGPKKVVLLTHCYACSSSAYVALGPTKALAFMVADAGYDVWLLNVRGARNSRRHVRLSPHSDEFWKFGFHENGIYDAAATIDFILKYTGESKLDYIGFSLGHIMFLALMSEKPEYNLKVRSMISLAPVAYNKEATGIAFGLAPFVTTVAKVFGNVRRLDVPPEELRINELMMVFCDPKNGLIYGSICDLLSDALAVKSENVDRELLPFFFSTFPDMGSLRTLIHFGQLRNSGKFQKYSFGRRINLIKYGSISPPEYNLSRIVVPISCFWGASDPFLSTSGVSRLLSELPNVVFSKRIPSYTHFDMIWAKNAPSMVYEPILGILKNA